MIHISKAEAIRDIGALLQKAAAGESILIDSGTEHPIVIGPAEILDSGYTSDEDKEADHDEWVRARVQEALDDPRPGVPFEEVKARSDKKFAEAIRNEEKRKATV
ncbi:MAG: hypothetical protein WDN23_02560 [Edaphobacter sp.]